MGLLGMIRESMFGKQKDPWREMPLSTFFSEGWFEPWYYYPRSTTGALLSGSKRSSLASREPSSDSPNSFRLREN